jgi:tetratricopeptide (TPR) repeat protein
MKVADKDDADALLQWCEKRSLREGSASDVSTVSSSPNTDEDIIDERSLRDEIENFPKDGDPSDLGDLFSELGDLLADMDDVIGAEKAYREGTRRAPGCASCYGSLASTLKDRNDLAGAERVLRRGIANFTKGGAFPDVNVLYNDLLELLDDKGDKRGAELVYREVIKNFPKDGDLSDLGTLFDQLVAPLGKRE